MVLPSRSRWYSPSCAAQGLLSRLFSPPSRPITGRYSLLTVDIDPNFNCPVGDDPAYRCGQDQRGGGLNYHLKDLRA